MNSVSSNQSEVSVQLGLFDAIKDLLFVHPVFLLGIIVIGVMLFFIFRKNRTNRIIPIIKISILSLLLYYYLCVMLTNIVGIPCISEYRRLAEIGESFFDPNINLIPFSDGISMGFIFNIILFIPLGFLCPLISKNYQCVKNVFLIGFGMSLSIEIVQLFTLYRATDVDDLMANVAGTLVGYLCFRFVDKLILTRIRSIKDFKETDFMKCIPVIIIITTFILGFLR